MYEIMRRDPFLSRSMRDLMSFIESDPLFARSSGNSNADEGNLALDVSEGEGELIVRASMPGFDKKDIDVQIHNGVLSIKGTHVEEDESKDERFYRRERRTGSVSRRVALPGVVDDAEAKAELKDGILTLRIPQKDVARPKQIPVA